MSKEIIKKEIDQIIETIIEQWEIIGAYKGKIPLIEMDIFMGNIRKLYDDFYLLDKINKTPGFDTEKIRSQITREPSFVFETGSNPKPANITEKDEPVHHVESQAGSTPEEETEPTKEIFVLTEPESFSDIEPVFEAPSEPEHELIGENVIGSSTNHEAEPEDEPEEEPVSETSSETHITANEADTHLDEPEATKEPTKQPVFKKPSPAPMPDLFGSAPTLAEKYQADKKSVNDQLATNGNDNSLGNRMQQSQISDLKAAIGINDKFLFINELFKGDLAGYNRAIENLNACHFRQEAFEKLETMRDQFKWSENSTSLARLNEFLKRRFGA